MKRAPPARIANVNYHGTQQHAADIGDASSAEPHRHFRCSVSIPLLRPHSADVSAPSSHRRACPDSPPLFEDALCAVGCADNHHTQLPKAPHPCIYTPPVGTARAAALPRRTQTPPRRLGHFSPPTLCRRCKPSMGRHRGAGTRCRRCRWSPTTTTMRRAPRPSQRCRPPRRGAPPTPPRGRRSRFAPRPHGRVCRGRMRRLRWVRAWRRGPSGGPAAWGAAAASGAGCAWTRLRVTRSHRESLRRRQA